MFRDTTSSISTPNSLHCHIIREITTGMLTPDSLNCPIFRDITSGMSTPDSTSLASTSSNSDDYRGLINNSRGSGIRTRVSGNTRVRKNNGYGNKIREPRLEIIWVSF